MNYKPNKNMPEKNNTTTTFTISYNAIIAFLFSISFIFFQINIEAGNLCQKQESEDFTVSEGLLWEIQHTDLQHSSYIFGTIHVDDERVMEVSDKMIDEIFDEINQLWVELIPGDIDFNTIAKHIMMEETTLSELLSEEEFAILEKWAEENLGLPAEMLNNIKPLYIHSIYMMTNQMGAGGMEVQDMKIMRKAQEREIEVKALEDAEEQFKAMETIPVEEQAEDLARALRGEEGGTLDDQLEELIGIYLREDLAAMMELSEAFGSFQYGKDAILHDRNKNMWDKIKPELKENPLLIAVGSLHLPGNTGLLKALCEAGYDVRRIKLD